MSKKKEMQPHIYRYFAATKIAWYVCHSCIFMPKLVHFFFASNILTSCICVASIGLVIQFIADTNYILMTCLSLSNRFAISYVCHFSRTLHQHVKRFLEGFVSVVVVFFSLPFSLSLSWYIKTSFYSIVMAWLYCTMVTCMQARFCNEIEKKKKKKHIKEEERDAVYVCVCDGEIEQS